MNLVLFQYPALMALSVLCAVLAAAALRTGRLAWCLAAGVCFIAQVMGALMCMLPWAELVLTLLLPVVSALFAMRGEVSQ